MNNRKNFLVDATKEENQHNNLNKNTTTLQKALPDNKDKDIDILDQNVSSELCKRLKEILLQYIKSRVKEIQFSDAKDNIECDFFPTLCTQYVRNTKRSKDKFQAAVCLYNTFPDVTYRKLLDLLKEEQNKNSSHINHGCSFFRWTDHFAGALDKMILAIPASIKNKYYQLQKNRFQQEFLANHILAGLNQR